MVRFYRPEVLFLREQWQLPEIQHIVNRSEPNGKIQDIANALCPAFLLHCTEPYAGETDAEFKKRKGNMKRDKKELAVKKPAETEEEFGERLDSLAEVCASVVGICADDVLR